VDRPFAVVGVGIAIVRHGAVPGVAGAIDAGAGIADGPGAARVGLAEAGTDADFADEDGPRGAVGERPRVGAEVNAHDAPGRGAVGQADPRLGPGTGRAAAVHGAGPAEDVGLVDTGGVAGVVAAGPPGASGAVPFDLVPNVRRADHDRDGLAADRPPAVVA